MVFCERFTYSTDRYVCNCRFNPHNGNNNSHGISFAVSYCNELQNYDGYNDDCLWDLSHSNHYNKKSS
jgi:hypothetical protein